MPASRLSPLAWGRDDLVAVAVLLVLVAIHTWPIASSPAATSFNYNHDAMLHAWIIAWVSRTLVTAPSSLLDGNIFHPADNSLVYSDSMLAPAAMGIPFYWLTGDVVLTHNLVWLLGAALSALAMYLLVRELTTDRWAACLSGSLFIFNAHIGTRLPHVMAMHMEWIPLAFLALERLLGRRRPHDAAILGLSVAGAVLTSGYLLNYLLVGLGVLLIAHVPDWIRRRPLQLLGLLAAGAVASVIVALPLIYPWLEQAAGRRGGSPATLATYLTPSSELHMLWGYRLWDAETQDAMFPGLVPAALALLALAGARGGKPGARRVWAYAALGLVGLLLSLGPATPLYRIIGTLYPPVLAVRAVSRFGVLFLTAIAVLAGFGLARLRRRVPDGTPARVALAVLVLVANAEVFSVPFTEPTRPIPEIYQRLPRANERAVLIEFPYHGFPGARHLDAEYVFNSTAHWKRLVNGYGSYVPPSHHDIGNWLAGFPNGDSLEIMRRFRVTHVLVHMGRFSDQERREIVEFVAAQPEFELLASDADDRRLYRFRRSNRRDE